MGGGAVQNGFELEIKRNSAGNGSAHILKSFLAYGETKGYNETNKNGTGSTPVVYGGLSMLDIAYSLDHGYVIPTAVSIKSLLENRDSDLLRIHILGYHLTKKDIDGIRTICGSYSVPVLFYEIDEWLDKYKALHRERGQIGTYGRLLVGYFLDESIKRVLYLDGDTLIVSGLKHMNNVELFDNILAGVYDISLPDCGCREIIHFSEEEQYINAGVIWINLELWRKENIERKCFEYLKKKPDAIFNDQDAINAVCRGRISLLPLSMNMTALTPVLPFRCERLVADKYFEKYCSREEYEEAQKNPVIIHFASELFGKPWQEGCVAPYAKVWRKYLHGTPFRHMKKVPRVFSKNKYRAIYLKNAEGIIRFFYKRRMYFFAAVFYKLFYLYGHKILKVVRRKP